MAGEAQHEHHGIDYVEITVGSVEGAKTFYSEAFGWTFNDYGPDYAGIVGKHREVGGLTTGEASGGGPLVVLYSSDLDASLTAVVASGGKIVTPPFEFPGGRRFHFADPFGNELAVWSPH